MNQLTNADLLRLATTFVAHLAKPEAIGGVVAAAVVANNPELAPLEPEIAADIAGVLARVTRRGTA